MTLPGLLEQAGAASPHERIQWRDPIAAHGVAAIAAIEPWFADRTLSAFAVRVVQRVGENGQSAQAIAALQNARSRVPPHVKADLNAAIRTLQRQSRGAPVVDVDDGVSPRRGGQQPPAIK